MLAKQDSTIVVVAASLAISDFNLDYLLRDFA